MKSGSAAPKNIDAYIAGFPRDTRKLLRKLRATVRRAAPAAEEAISYGIPAYRLEGRLVYFAAFQDHLSFFPTTSAIRKFRRELSTYDGAKGTVRFPFDRPVPHGLIGRIVKFRVKENLARAVAKARVPRRVRPAK